MDFLEVKNDDKVLVSDSDEEKSFHGFDFVIKYENTNPVYPLKKKSEFSEKVSDTEMSGDNKDDINSIETVKKSLSENLTYSKIEDNGNKHSSETKKIETALFEDDKPTIKIDHDSDVDITKLKTDCDVKFTDSENENSFHGFDFVIKYENTNPVYPLKTKSEFSEKVSDTEMSGDDKDDINSIETLKESLSENLAYSKIQDNRNKHSLETKKIEPALLEDSKPTIKINHDSDVDITKLKTVCDVKCIDSENENRFHGFDCVVGYKNVTHPFHNVKKEALALECTNNIQNSYKAFTNMKNGNEVIPVMDSDEENSFHGFDCVVEYKNIVPFQNLKKETFVLVDSNNKRDKRVCSPYPTVFLHFPSNDSRNNRQNSPDPLLEDPRRKRKGTPELSTQRPLKIKKELEGGSDVKPELNSICTSAMSPVVLLERLDLTQEVLSANDQYIVDRDDKARQALDSVHLSLTSPVVILERLDLESDVLSVKQKQNVKMKSFGVEQYINLTTNELALKECLDESACAENSSGDLDFNQSKLTQTVLTEPNTKVYKYLKYENCKKEFLSIIQMKEHNKNYQNNCTRFYCNICCYIFKTESLFNLHFQSKHPLTCRFCNRKFMNKTKLKVHISYWHSSLKFACDVCDKKCFSASVLKTHVAQHHTDIRLYSCEICEKAFSQKNSLKKHQHVHNDDRPFSCHECGKTFKTNSNLSDHKTTHKGRKFSCEDCGKALSSKDSLKSHYLRVHPEVDSNRMKKLGFTKEKNFTCGYCQKPFGKKLILSQHIQYWYPAHILRCEYCSKSFSKKQSLVFHIRSKHTNEKPFKCEVCAKTFCQVSVLNLHRAIHSDARPFSCDTCHKSYKSKSGLRYHERGHRGQTVKSYKCTVCNNKYFKYENYKTHIETHDPAQVFPCSICGKGFRSKSHLYGHIKIHKQPEEACEHCGKKFKRKEYLKTHKDIVHSDGKKFRCVNCGGSFKQREILSFHLKTSCFTCELCGKKLDSYGKFKHHQVLAHAETKPTCEICGYICATKTMLRCHKLRHTKKQPIQCKMCLYFFKHKEAYDKHVNMLHKSLKQE